MEGNKLNNPRMNIDTTLQQYEEGATTPPSQEGFVNHVVPNTDANLAVDQNIGAILNELVAQTLEQTRMIHE